METGLARLACSFETGWVLRVVQCLSVVFKVATRGAQYQH